MYSLNLVLINLDITQITQMMFLILMYEDSNSNDTFSLLYLSPRLKVDPQWIISKNVRCCAARGSAVRYL